jgi:hypothetical protein
MHRAALLAIAVSSVLFAVRARADACVEIDPERDTLSEQDRAAARSLFLQALETNGQRVSGGRNSGQCTAVYRIYNVRLGSSVTSTVAVPQGTRTGSVRAVEDLPNVYDQMVRALLSGEPISNSSGSALTRENVTASQAAPNRAEADSLWYARLARAFMVGGARAEAGPVSGSATGTSSTPSARPLLPQPRDLQERAAERVRGERDERLRRGQARLLLRVGHGELELLRRRGLSWGRFRRGRPCGVQRERAPGEVSLGFGPRQHDPPVLQADGTFPFWRATPMPARSPASDSRYTPTFVISLGGGFGRNRPPT